MLEVGVLEECGGLWGHRCCKTNQGVSQPDVLTFLCRKDESTGYILSTGSLTSSLSLFGYANGDIGLWFESLTVACQRTSTDYSRKEL